MDMPLHRTLDRIIEDGANLDSVFWFLGNLTDRQVVDVLAKSWLSGRLFQADVACKAKEQHVERMAKLLEHMNHQQAAKFAWQMCIAPVHERVKNPFRRFLKNHKVESHPYKSKMSQSTQQFLDSRFLEQLSSGECDFSKVPSMLIGDASFAEGRTVASLPIHGMAPYSLFDDRIWQLDFFRQLSAKTKYLMLAKIDATAGRTRTNFIKQLLDSDLIEEKRYMAKFVMEHYGTVVYSCCSRCGLKQATEWLYAGADQFKELTLMLDEAKTASELLMRMAIAGLELDEDCILYLLESANKADVVRDIAAKRPDVLNRVMRCGDAL